MKKPNTHMLRAICPIYGLGWVATGLQLTPTATLRFVEFENESKELAGVGLLAIKYRCLIEVVEEYDHDADPWSVICEMVLTIEAALRTYHEGKVGIAGIIYYDNDQYQSARILDGFLPNGQEDYQIDKPKLEAFPAFFNLFQVAYERKPVALQYFSNSLRRFSRNDKAIDLCTCLESLFVPVSSRGTKKVFLTQGMRVLGFSDNEMQMINDLYEFRNTIIHGDHTQRASLWAKRKGLFTSSWFEDCENLVRTIVQRYVQKPW